MAPTDTTATPEPTMTVELTCAATHRVVVRGKPLAHGEPHTLPVSTAKKLIKAEVAKLAAPGSAAAKATTA